MAATCPICTARPATPEQPHPCNHCQARKPSFPKAVVRSLNGRVSAGSRRSLVNTFKNKDKVERTRLVCEEYIVSKKKKSAQM